MALPDAVDIVIVNYRSTDDTLAALAVLTPWLRGQILLVDNSEDAAERAQLSRAVEGIAGLRLIVPQRNLGFGEGCNLAFGQCTAEFVLLLNPDARIEPRHIAMLVEALKGDPGLAGVSPKTFWDATQRFLLPTAFPQTPLVTLAMTLAQRAPGLAKWAAGRYLRKMQGDMDASGPYPISFLVGAVMMLRRSAVLASGGLFDPAYFMFYEDSDLSLRLRRAGYRLGIVPRAEAVHEYRHKAYKAGLMADTYQIYFAKNFPLFYRLTGRLSRLPRWGRPVNWDTWGAMLRGPVSDPAELHARLGGAGVVAFSPSPMMMPAIFRPSGANPVFLTAQDWARLEPGPYMLLCAGGQGGPALRWVGFERADTEAVANAG
jgi:GT2 family glycosyltransferase